MAKIFRDFFGLVFFRISGPPKKFTPSIVGISLQLHFLKPKMFSRQFSAYWRDQDLGRDFAGVVQIAVSKGTILL